MRKERARRDVQGVRGEDDRRERPQRKDEREPAEHGEGGVPVQAGNGLQGHHVWLSKGVRAALEGHGKIDEHHRQAHAAAAHDSERGHQPRAGEGRRLPVQEIQDKEREGALRVAYAAGAETARKAGAGGRGTAARARRLPVLLLHGVEVFGLREDETRLGGEDKRQAVAALLHEEDAHGGEAAPAAALRRQGAGHHRQVRRHKPPCAHLRQP